jgi:hypothetical protein
MQVATSHTLFRGPTSPAAGARRVQKGAATRGAPRQGARASGVPGAMRAAAAAPPAPPAHRTACSSAQAKVLTAPSPHGAHWRAPAATLQAETPLPSIDAIVGRLHAKRQAWVDTAVPQRIRMLQVTPKPGRAA